MLMTPITPKVIASPIAASSSTEPSDSPYQAFCTVAQTASCFWIAVTASRAARLTAAGESAGSPASRFERVLVAARADHADGGELVGLGRIVGIEHDGGARLGQRALHPRVGFLGERGIERGQRALARAT